VKQSLTDHTGELIQSLNGGAGSLRTLLVRACPADVLEAATPRTIEVRSGASTAEIEVHVESEPKESSWLEGFEEAQEVLAHVATALITSKLEHIEQVVEKTGLTIREATIIAIDEEKKLRPPLGDI